MGVDLTINNNNTFIASAPLGETWGERWELTSDGRIKLIVKKISDSKYRWLDNNAYRASIKQFFGNDILFGVLKEDKMSIYNSEGEIVSVGLYGNRIRQEYTKMVTK